MVAFLKCYNVSIFVKICLINTNPEWGGGEKWHHQTALKLNAVGYEVVVVTQPESPLALALRDLIRVVEFRLDNLSFLNPLINYQLSEFFNTEQFDSVIMNLPRDVKAFAKPAAKAGVRKVIYRRGMNHPIKASLINRYYYRNFVTDIIANSEAVRRSVFQNIPELEQKITIIPNGVKIDMVCEKMPPRKDKILIGNLGRLVEQKGQIDLIKLGKFFLSKKIAFHIFIGGDGPLHEELQNQIFQNDLKSNVTLLGKIDPVHFFPKVDYFVFPSRFEGLSNAMLEALQYGKPILCYDVASNSEIVADGQNGYVVNPFEIEEIGERLIQLHSDADKYVRMQSAGYEMLREKYDEEKLFRKLEKLLAADSQEG